MEKFLRKLRWIQRKMKLPCMRIAKILHPKELSLKEVFWKSVIIEHID